MSFVSSMIRVSVEGFRPVKSKPFRSPSELPSIAPSINGLMRSNLDLTSTSLRKITSQMAQYLRSFPSHPHQIGSETASHSTSPDAGRT